jgi:2-hydroxychromene-2-carboxylate isomerase
VAQGYGLAFPQRDRAPDAAQVRLAARALADAIARRRFADAAAPVGAALWSGEPIELRGSDDAAARAAVEAGNALRRRLGHYLGAMFHYGGEWYWGVDRLHHLERRLTGVGLRRPGSGESPLVPRPEEALGLLGPEPRAGERLGLEFHLSLRSPYSYIAIERTLDLARRLPVDLAFRPVLPMVMRGLPVPPEKRLYILLDAKREAEAARIPFGRVCDPVGRPVERCFSLWRWSRERGREAELLLSFSRAVFAEGVDAGADAGMRRVVEAAGLPWSEARERLDRDDGWRSELEDNRQALLGLGLWGVPSYHLIGRAEEPDFSTWGQDRLWRIEAEIRSRLSRPVAVPVAD